MPNYQHSKFVYENEKQLKAKYGLNKSDFKKQSNDIPYIWKGHSLNFNYDDETRHDQMVLCFGNPLDANFRKNNIDDLVIKKDMFAGRKRDVYLQVNVSIKSILKSALEEVAEWANKSIGKSDKVNYNIRSFSSYCFRYKAITSHLKIYSKRLEAKKWFEKTDRYKQLMKEKWVQRGGWPVISHIGCAEYDKHFGLTNKTKISNLSNHSYGTAIDINISENPMEKTVWDMPAEIVKIMYKHGFYWGGFYYNSRKQNKGFGKDAMHFEYMLDNVKTSQVTYPLSSNISDSPMKYFYNNENIESGIGGFYALGLQRNLHGGAHLFSPNKKSDTIVKAPIPGHVVAARLPVLGKSESSSKEIVKSIRNWPGFILLKHSYKDKSDKSLHSIYTLYQHVVSPKDYSNFDFKSSFNNVPWFKSLHLSRYGALIRTSYTSDVLKNIAVGDMVWVAEEVKDKATQFKVYNNDKIETVKNDGSWFYKPSPADYKSAIETLAKGKVVAFSEPFFPVEKGETIGFINKLPEGYVSPKTIEVNNEKVSLNSGFLHWEMFDISKDKSGIRTLISKLDSIGCKSEALFNILEEGDDADNFIQLTELKSKLSPCLPEDEKTLFEKAIDESEEGEKANVSDPFNYIKYVLNIVDDSFVFAPQDGNDIGTADTKKTYPVKLKIDVSNFPKPSAFITSKNAVFEVILKVDKLETGLASGELTITDELYDSAEDNDGKKIVTCTIQVPAMADILEIKPKKAEVDNETFIISKSNKEENKADLFKNIISRHFRNTRLTKENEFTYKGIEKFITGAMKEVNPNVKNEDINDINMKVKPMAWWEDDQVVVIKRNMLKSINDNVAVSEVKKEGDLKDAEKKLFGDGENQLPVNAKIDNINPITGTWLLDILTQEDKLKIITAPQKYYSEEDSNPIGWGVIDYKKEDVVSVGDTKKVIVVDDDYGYDKSNKFTMLFKLGDKILSFGKYPFGKFGVSIIPFRANMWGEWDVFINSANNTPQSTINILKLSVKAPKFDNPTIKEEDIFSLSNLGKGNFRWLIKTKAVDNSYPKEIHGYVYIETTNDISDTKSWSKKAYFPIKGISGLSTQGKLIKNPENLNIIDGIITGYKNKKGSITDSLTYNEYSKVYKKMDSVYGFLLNELQNIRTDYCDFDYSNDNVTKKKEKKNYGKISLKSISIDGYSLTIADRKWDVDNGVIKRNRELYDQCLTTFKTNKVKAIEAIPLGEDLVPLNDFKKGDIYSIKLVSKNNGQKKDNWKNLKTGNMKIDSEGMVNGKTKKAQMTDKFWWNEFTPLFPEFRLSVQLAEAIQILRSKDLGGMTPTMLSTDGMSCSISTGGAQAYYDLFENDSSISSIFSSFTKDKKILTVAVEELPENALALNIECKEKFDEIVNELQSSDKELLFYRFGFDAINGFDVDNPKIYDEMDKKIHSTLSKNVLTEEEFKKIEKLAPATLSYPVKSMVCSIIKPGIKDFYFTINTSLQKDGTSRGYLNINAELKGDASFWNDKDVKLFYFSNNNFVQFNTVAIDNNKRISRFGFPKSKSSHIKRKFKLEAANFEKVIEYDFTPKLMGFKKEDSFDFDIIDNYLLITCWSSGIEPPLGLPVSDKTIVSDWEQAIIKNEGAGRNLTLVISSESLDKKQLSALKNKIEYEIYSSKYKCGFCDTVGVFRARISLNALKDKVKYKFDISRKVREDNVSLSGEYEYLKPKEEETQEAVEEKNEVENE